MSTDYPLISVIVPVYQVELYLNKCIESLVCQTYPNFQILLIDDGSPDRCPELCDAWAKKDPRILTFHKKNGGQSDARNYGLDHASGSYVTFVDSDDYVAPEYLETLYDVLCKYNADVSACNATLVNTNGEMLPPNFKPLEAGQYTNTDMFYHYFDFCGSGPILVTPWGKLYKASLFQTLRFSTGRYYEDEFLYVPLYRQVRCVAYTDAALYYYVQRQGSIMHTALTAKRFEDLRALSEERLEQFSNEPTLYRKSAADYAFRMFAVIDQANEPSILRQMTQLYRRYIWYVLFPCVDLPLRRKLAYCMMAIAPRQFASRLHKAHTSSVN